jgi:hypothetical protein
LSLFIIIYLKTQDFAIQTKEMQDQTVQRLRTFLAVMMFFGLIAVLGFFYGIASPNFRRDKEVAIFAIAVFMLHQIIFVLLVEDPTVYVIGIAIFALYSSITAFSLINVYFTDDDERYTEQDLTWADLIVFLVFLNNIATIAIARMNRGTLIEE